MDISPIDISKYGYIQQYFGYIPMDISKKIYLFMDIMKLDITGYVDNGCILKHKSTTDISKKHTSKRDISKKDNSLGYIHGFRQF